MQRGSRANDPEAICFSVGRANRTPFELDRSADGEARAVGCGWGRRRWSCDLDLCRGADPASASHVQISAVVSEETRVLFDEVTKARGLRKGHVIEDVLLHYPHAPRELPSDLIIPGRLVLTEASAREVAGLLANPRAPTPTMQALMEHEDGVDVPG